ncbi:hypothetical protein [Methanofollis tationis]|uniref:Uncharacterized protein n=1 Tax=Methanofollis tationis TaxID=81417 RepID=A0A7K4HNA5_9EURY|nr:hypothetical protein [Methanofollis tationis]NVO66756.1 hypothetical protein [Methanofollis tationis]
MDRTNDDALMSIDFLAGFTIFLLSLIVAAGMVPGMLAGLQSATIDYDGVAYRTSVILAEDPGWWFDDVTMSGSSHWEGERTAMDRVERMGLAVSKRLPNVLSAGKIESFFSTNYTYPDDYRDRVFFSEIPYSFNISLKADDFAYRLGDGTPDGEYGSIRRTVLVKNASSATLNFSDAAVLTAYADPATAPGATSTFTVSLNFTDLLAPSPAYRIDPFGERITIRIENLNKTFYNGAQNATLTTVKLYRGATWVPPNLPDANSRLYIDGAQVNTTSPPVEVENNLKVVLEPGFFTGKASETSTMDLKFTFANTPGTNTTVRGVFNYTKTDDNITMPLLKPAVLEVAVW